MSVPLVGAYPGSFDPLTVAHLAIGDAAVRRAGLERVDFVLSNVALGKPDGAHASVGARAAAIRRAGRELPWLGVAITDAQLVADIAAPYDVVVMGADKWAQVRDPAWYGNDVEARDAAVASLPRVLVVPRPGFAIVGAEALDIDPELAGVSSTRARAGERHLVAPRAHRRLLVDGNNVMGSNPDGWWRDRTGAARRLVAALQELAARTGEEIAVVFDGRPLPELPEGSHAGVYVVYARRAGRNAADDRIVEQVAADDEPESITVVTSDRALADRVRPFGARVEGARSLTRALGTGPR